ncbi:hypothetical protein BGZ98_005391 [Dissophora globulifera]|nr:hypothetical protein BGZ98_005391 [Dissophora globulifera]
MHLSASFIAAATTAAAGFLATVVQAQQPAGRDRAPPRTGQTVNILFSFDANRDLGAEDVPFNTCHISAYSQDTGYAYLTFAPKNATINFYKDDRCQEFAFGLDGYYGRNPGPAKSYRWVGWTEDALGELFDKDPFQGQGDAANGGSGDSPPSGPNPATGGGQGGGGGAAKPAPVTGPGPATVPAPDGTHDEGEEEADFSTFIGGAFGTLVILSIGGVVFWKTAGRRMVSDLKAQELLPYNRMDDDDHIDLDQNAIMMSSKSQSQTFELGDEGDDEDTHNSREDQETDRLRPLLPGKVERRQRYEDDDDDDV